MRSPEPCAVLAHPPGVLDRNETIPVAATGVPFANLLKLTGVNIPYGHGLSAVVLTGGTAFSLGTVAVNVYHR